MEKKCQQFFFSSSCFQLNFKWSSFFLNRNSTFELAPVIESDSFIKINSIEQLKLYLQSCNSIISSIIFDCTLKRDLAKRYNPLTIKHVIDFIKKKLEY